LLGAEKPFLASIFPRLLAVMGKDHQELHTAKERICEILTIEEESFLKTLKKGGNILSSILHKAQQDAKKEISGADAFKLKDTYGFPIEEILLLAKDSDVHVNLDAFALLEVEAKERSKKTKETHHQTISSSQYTSILEKHGSSEFLGFTENELEASVVAILKDGEETDVLEEGEEAVILLDKTPFYAEKGGQVSDKGVLFHEGARFIVEESLHPLPSLTVHRGKLEKGTLITGEPVTAQINIERRESIENNHSATHLLHWALQRVLGEHIRQAGSLVEPDKLRFDFNHHKAISREELREVERLVNIKIRSNAPVKFYELSYEEAQGKQEIKQFFGDKYGSTVRVVDIADFSKELCGGTHVPALGRLGLLKVVKESSIAKGVRRIEAVTGKKAEEFVHSMEDKLAHIETLLSAPASQVLEKLQHTLEENQELKNVAKKQRNTELHKIVQSLKKECQTTNGVHYVFAEVSITPQELHSFANMASAELPQTTLLLAANHEGKCMLLLKVHEAHAQKGLEATEIIKELAPLIKGSGGGKGCSAQAGGTYPEGCKEAFAKFTTLIEKL